MIVYQVEVRDTFVSFEHFRNKRKALSSAREWSKCEAEQVIVRKIDTGKARPFDLIKMFGDTSTETLSPGRYLPNDPNLPIASSEYIWEYYDYA